MTHDARAIADAILHEGYLLYPYSRSALKNLHRFPFGTLYPETFCRTWAEGDASSARLEHIVIGGSAARLSVEARFLQLLDSGAEVRSVFAPPSPLPGCARALSFALRPLRCELSVAAEQIEHDAWKIAVDLKNTAPFDGDATREEALRFALVSAHLLVRTEGGELVSAIDPPSEVRPWIDRCRSRGLWPVLLGEPGARDTLLAAPIILYDHPQIAPESPGDFFDATEIDELLTLRVLTLSDEEKSAIAAEDPRARELLARTEALGLGALEDLHGRLREPQGLGPGVRVRLRPKGRADIFDVALDGKLATIVAIERDLEGGTHVVVTVDDDPGRDLGAYGHRFFFKPEEVELP